MRESRPYAMLHNQRGRVVKTAIALLDHFQQACHNVRRPPVRSGQAKDHAHVRDTVNLSPQSESQDDNHDVPAALRRLDEPN